MTIQGSSGALDSLLLQLLQQQKADNAAPIPAAVKNQKKPETQDVVSLSGKKPEDHNGKKQSQFNQNQSLLVSEDTKEVEHGYRRTQEFKNAQGKEFIRIEEVTTTPDRTKRITIQQNSSGSTTALENILDRQTDGTFRLTQRYTDEVGKTSTNITLGVNPIDADILLGRPPSSKGHAEPPPFQQHRGTQFDARV